MHNRVNKTRGFTLIELLVVISIIGVLAGLIMVNFNSARERTRDTQRKSDLAQVKRALLLYHNDNNAYPTAIELVWGAQFGSGTMVYMKRVPEDPGGGGYHYRPHLTDPNDYCLWATLENSSDASAAESQSLCGTTGCSGIIPGTNDYMVCAD